MTVLLEIEDSSLPHWWLSPNVWTVPNDPEGPEGLPVVGSPCYLWARVKNNGDEKVENATVRFYWANPAAGFDRNTANKVGTASVTLEKGQTSEVLCLTPWTPIFVNGGHECILAEAFQTSRDPLPTTPVFNVPTDRHVAQRNLSVLMASGRFHFAFEVHNTIRKARTFTVNFKKGKLAEIEPLVPLLGRGFKLPQERGQIQRPGFVRSSCPDNKELEDEIPHVCELELAPNSRAGYSFVGILEGSAALVHIVQEAEGQVVGGLSLLIINTKGK